MSSVPVNVQRFLDRLDGVHRSGDGWSASCPCRADDRNPSLTVGVGKDGQVLVNCHRGVPCNLEEICGAVNVRPEQLWPEDDTPWEPAPRRESRPDTGKPSKRSQGPGRLEKVYDYTDVDGTLVMQVLRYRTEDGGKTFRQRVPDGSGGWHWSTQQLVERPLYRLPEVAAAVVAGEPVWVVEGEKDADALAAAGHAATCNPMGADNGSGNKWRPEHTAVLAGAKVWLVADRDEAGLVHADYVLGELEAAGARVRLRTVVAPYKDPADVLAAGLPIEENLEEPVRTGDTTHDTTGDTTGDGRHDGRHDTTGEATGDTTRDERHDTGHDTGQAIDIAAVTAMLDEVLGDHKVDPARRLTKARRILEEAGGTNTRRENPGRLTSWHELVSEEDQGYEWLIPGVLERGERVMIVAAEGVGKTMLARQVAICCAAGTHPFTMSRIEPVRTLFVDLENPERIIRRTARRIVDNVKLHWPDRPGTAADLWIKPDGIDVLKARDRDRLEEVIEKSRPDLIVLGPIYKAFVDPGNRSSEATVIEVATYLDRIRELYGCALWLEHHAPLGNSLSGRDLRPMGSAVWMRWPEFGYALVPDPTASERIYEIKQWRGPRDDRDWPTKLRRGNVLPFETVD